MGRTPLHHWTRCGHQCRHSDPHCRPSELMRRTAIALALLAATGCVRSQQSPLVLDALLQVPETAYPLPRAKVDQALSFIRSHTTPGGALGLSDPGIPDY